MHQYLNELAGLDDQLLLLMVGEISHLNIKVVFFQMKNTHLP